MSSAPFLQPLHLHHHYKCRWHHRGWTCDWWDKAAHRREAANMVSWYDLTFNMKEIIVDKRKGRTSRSNVKELQMEMVSNFKYLGVHISTDLRWTVNITQMDKVHQQPYLMRRVNTFTKARCSTTRAALLRTSSHREVWQHWCYGPLMHAEGITRTTLFSLHW